ncbi:hypothetical protein ATCC90586_001752 [Pythium insidiosum]|nr:hypothetical protein ATCC90586_001752 [Pythium insidiosum]
MFLLKPQDAARQQAERVASPSILPRPQGVVMVAREWKYVAEGGANVLFRHHPPADAEPNDAVEMFRGKLLRVKKCDAVVKPKKRKNKNAVTVAAKYPAHYPHPLQVLEYATNDILPYLVQRTEGAIAGRGSRSSSKWVYDQVAQLMEVEKRFLVDLNDQLLSLESRPEHRRQSQIDVELQCVMLLPDVTLPSPDDSTLSIIEPPRVRSSRALTLDDGSGSTTEQTDEDICDQLAEEMESVIQESRQRGDSIDEDSGSNSWVSSSTTSSSSGDDAAITDDVDEHGDDADASENDDYGPEDERDDTVLMPPQQRCRLPSGGCDVFDCCFRNICVEIKPKIGFKPSGSLIPEIKQRVCRFCMHQHFKRSTGKVEEISEFCPLDLYSRNPDRIRKAFRALQRTPQNNFKVFVRSNNDAVVNIITGMNADALPKGVAQAKYSCKRKRMGFRHSCQSIGAESELELDFDSPPVGEKLLPDVMELLTEVLMNLEILEDLKKMQQLDHISVDGMWHLQNLLHELSGVASEQNQHSPLSPMLLDLVHLLRTEADAQQEDDDRMRPGSLNRCLAFLDVALAAVADIDVTKGARSWKELSLSSFTEFYAQLVRRFQVATTLKDCSLLLCLRRVDSSDAAIASLASGGSIQRVPRKRFDHLQEYEHVVVFRNMAFHCVIAVVDLDVKSHKSVDDYYQLDEKIVQHFAAAFGHRVDLECEA